MIERPANGRTVHGRCRARGRIHHATGVYQARVYHVLRQLRRERGLLSHRIVICRGARVEAGELGHRIVSQQMELEERINQLSEQLLDKPDDNGIEPKESRDTEECSRRDAQLMEAVRKGRRKGYDRPGEERYDMISALHKCLRGSDGSAAMYWLAR